MRNLVLIFLALIGVAAKGQGVAREFKTHFETTISKLKPSGDSIANLIEGQILVKTVDDTIYVTSENNLDSIAGTYIEQIYCDISGVLKKTVVYRYPEISYVFYYDSSFLRKAAVKNLETQELKLYYYGKVENELSSFITTRIAYAFPEFAAYFNHLKMGKSFLNQAAIKRKNKDQASTMSEK